MVYNNCGLKKPFTLSIINGILFLLNILPYTTPKKMESEHCEAIALNISHLSDQQVCFRDL